MISNRQRGHDWAQVSSLKHSTNGKYYDVIESIALIGFFSQLCFSLLDEVVQIYSDEIQKLNMKPICASIELQIVKTILFSLNDLSR